MPMKGSTPQSLLQLTEYSSAGFVDDEEELKGGPVAADDDDDDGSPIDSLDAAADAEDEDEEGVQVCCKANQT